MSSGDAHWVRKAIAALVAVAANRPVTQRERLLGETARDALAEAPPALVAAVTAELDSAAEGAGQ